MGIDTVCHESSMNEKGKTIAVLGAGFNHIYPKENVNLVKEIMVELLLVSTLQIQK